jgi:hypothetical protein
VLWAQDDVDRALISAKEMNSITGGQFPVAWLILNYDLRGVPEQRLTEFEEEFELQVIRSGITSPDRFASSDLPCGAGP